jgi:O-antigen/teichoic acid export membrane protein
MTNLALQLDSVVISQFLGVEDLALYTILSKTIGVCYLVYVGFLMAVWPSITEMASRSDWQKINQITRNTLTKGLLVGALVLGSAPIWVPHATQILSPSHRFSVPSSLVYLASFCQIIRMWTDTYSVVLQSTNNFSAFWYFMPLQVILNLLSQVALSKKYGLAGIYIGLILSSLATVAWGLPWFVRRIMRNDLDSKTESREPKF